MHTQPRDRLYSKYRALGPSLRLRAVYTLNPTGVNFEALGSYSGNPREYCDHLEQNNREAVCNLY